MYHVQFPGLGWEFTVSPTAFTIGNFSIAWYGIIIFLGLLLAYCYAEFSCRKFNIDADKVTNCVLVGMVCGIIGARAYYVLFYPGDMFIKNPLEIFRIRDGGLAIYGGLIGGLLGGAITAKICKMRIPAVLDLAALGFLIGQSIGRWGNFINQEAFGRETDLPWGMISEGTQRIVNGPVHPCFFYESVWCLLGFVLLHIFSRKLRKYDGQVFLLYIVWYGAGRFFIEGLRTDSLLTPVANLRVSQLVAAITVVIGIILLFVFRKCTALTGCGSKKIVELNALADDVPEELIENLFSDTGDSVEKPSPEPESGALHPEESFEEPVKVDAFGNESQEIAVHSFEEEKNQTPEE